MYVYVSILVLFSDSETSNFSQISEIDTDGHPETSSQFPSHDRICPLILKDVFVAPSFDELDAVAVDSKGDCRKLNSNHLSSIHNKGYVYL